MPLSSSVRKRGGLTAAPGEKPRNILVALFAASDKPPSRHSRGARQGHQNRCDYLHLHRPPDPFLRSQGRVPFASLTPAGVSSSGTPSPRRDPSLPLPSRGLLAPLVALTFSPGRDCPVSLPSVSSENKGRRCASHSLKGSGGETDANFCCTYFGPRLPPPRLSALSHRQLLGGDLEPPRLHSPHPRSCEMRRTGGLSRASAPRTGVPRPTFGRRAQLRAGQRPPPAARGGCARRRAPAPPPGRFCPSCSFRACQDCSTLSVLPRKRLSIHLEARDAPPLAGSVTAGAEEREERGSGACPSAPPAS